MSEEDDFFPRDPPQLEAPNIVTDALPPICTYGPASGSSSSGFSGFGPQDPEVASMEADILFQRICNNVTSVARSLPPSSSPHVPVTGFTLGETVAVAAVGGASRASPSTRTSAACHPGNQPPHPSTLINVLGGGASGGAGTATAAAASLTQCDSITPPPLVIQVLRVMSLR